MCFRILFGCLLFALAGCSAIQTSIEYSDLDVKASVERPVFLRHRPATLFFVLECPIVEFTALRTSLESEYHKRGYRIVENEETADVVMFIRVGDKSLTKFSARAAQGRRDATTSTGALAGAGTGYLSGGNVVGTVVGGIAGMTVGALTDATINSWVHLGVLDLDTGVLVREKAPSSQLPEYRETETAVNIRAKQAGIKWDEAAPAIQDSLASSLSRLLPDLKAYARAEGK